jgi:hypothetical protein
MKPRDAVDLNLTHWIVGTPVSVSLGRRSAPPAPGSEGVQIDLASGRVRPNPGWQAWWRLYTGEEWFTTPQARPGPVRLWLQRHALVLAAASLALLALDVAVLLAWYFWR